VTGLRGLPPPACPNSAPLGYLPPQGYTWEATEDGQLPACRTSLQDGICHRRGPPGIHRLCLTSGSGLPPCSMPPFAGFLPIKRTWDAGLGGFRLCRALPAGTSGRFPARTCLVSPHRAHAVLRFVDTGHAPMGLGQLPPGTACQATSPASRLHLTAPATLLRLEEDCTLHWEVPPRRRCTAALPATSLYHTVPATY